MNASVERDQSCTGGSCWKATYEVAWSLFDLAVFQDEKAQYPETPPTVWRANFYRTNFFETGQRNPEDYYAWHPTVPLGHGASFHKPGQFGTMRLVASAHAGGAGGGH